MRKKRSVTIRHKDKNISVAKTGSTKRRILIADDDPGIRDIFQIIFGVNYDLELKETGVDLFTNNFTLPDVS